MGTRTWRYIARKAEKNATRRFWQLASHAFNTQMVPILQALESGQGKEKLEPVLKNYLVINMVSTVETVLWNLAVYNIDKHNPDVSRVLKGDITIPVEALEKIAKGRVTKGKIVAANFNFANPHDMDEFFTNLLKLRFFETIKVMDKEDPFNWIERARSLDVNWDNFIEMFELRNRVVHDREMVKLSPSQLGSLVNCTMNLLEAGTVVGNFDYRHLIESHVASLKKWSNKKNLVRQQL